MSRKTKKWALLVTLLATAGAGCSPGSLGWLLQDSKVKPTNPLPPKADRDEVVVLVLASQSPGVSSDPLFMTAARDMAAGIAGELVLESKDTKTPIVVVDAAKVERHKQTLPDWRTVGPGVLGKQLGADYVIDASINSISLYSRQNANELYAGEAEVEIAVYDTATPEVKIQSYTHASKQPEKFKDASPAAYRNQFLRRLGIEIARKHVPYDTNERMRRMD